MTPIGSTSSNIRRAIGFIVYSSCRTLTRLARAHGDLDDGEPPNSSHVTGLTGRRYRRTLRPMTGSNRPRGHRTASPEFERMNANGLMGLHGDDLRIAADMEALVARVEQPTSLEDHELHPMRRPAHDADVASPAQTSDVGAVTATGSISSAASPRVRPQLSAWTFPRKRFRAGMAA